MPNLQRTLCSSATRRGAFDLPKQQIIGESPECFLRSGPKQCSYELNNVGMGRLGMGSGSGLGLGWRRGYPKIN